MGRFLHQSGNVALDRFFGIHERTRLLTKKQSSEIYLPKASTPDYFCFAALSEEFIQKQMASKSWIPLLCGWTCCYSLCLPLPRGRTNVDIGIGGEPMASQSSKIEWTESTGILCAVASEGCRFCYAERIFSGKGMAYEGLAENTKAGPRWTTEVRPVPKLLNAPLKWKKPRRIFVNSMSDLFHEKIELSYIQKVFSVMEEAHWHQFQVLTKRSERLLESYPKLPWSPNVWMGVSVEDSRVTHRIDALRQTGAQIKFLSLEPLLGGVGGDRLGHRRR